MTSSERLQLIDERIKNALHIWGDSQNEHHYAWLQTLQAERRQLYADMEWEAAMGMPDFTNADTDRRFQEKLDEERWKNRHWERP